MSKIEIVKKGHARDADTGPCTFTRYADGAIEYNRPGLYVPGIPKPTEWKARWEKASQTAQRFKKSIEDANKRDKLQAEILQKHIGKEHGSGWILTATDGHRALFGRGHGPKPDGDMDFTESGFPHFGEAYCEDPELHLAVKRALLMAPEKTSQIHLGISGGVLSIASAHKDEGRHGNEAGNFQQEMPVAHTGDGDAAFNGKYLEAILGFWPLRIIWSTKKGQDDRWIFTAIGDEDEYRFVLMPMRG